jgi:hypothetical protein
MELLDRYLESVKKYLPWERQDDIIAELRANLEAQREDREAELGRTLTEAEMKEWLKKIGPPIVVASRFQPQRYLIGPAIFPIYWLALRIICAWVFILYLIANTVEVFFYGAPTASQVAMVFAQAPFALIQTAFWVTFVFVMVELAIRSSPEKFPATAGCGWSPASLPPLEKAHAKGKKPRSIVDALAEIIFGSLGLAWLLLVPKHPWLLMGPGAAYLQASPFEAAPVLILFYWWIVAMGVLQIVWRCIDLARGAWQRPQRRQHIVMSVLGLVPLLLMLFAENHAVVQLKHHEIDMARYGNTLHTINHGIYQVALVLCAVAVVHLAVEAFISLRNERLRRLTEMR